MYASQAAQLSILLVTDPGQWQESLLRQGNLLNLEKLGGRFCK